MSPLSRQTSGRQRLPCRGGFHRSSLCAARLRPCPTAPSLVFPSAWGLGQLFWSLWVIYFILFYLFLLLSFPPGGETRLCSSPALQTTHAHLHRLYSEFWWQLRYFCLSTPFPRLLCDGGEDMSPSLLLLLAALLPTPPPGSHLPRCRWPWPSSSSGSAETAESCSQ